MQVPKGLETIRLSQQCKDQLIRLKRVTGIGQWNTLCRWALLTSLADPTEPAEGKVVGDSSVEMDWRTFSGEFGEVLLSSLFMRPKCENIDDAVPRHIARGLAVLAERHCGG